MPHQIAGSRRNEWSGAYGTTAKSKIRGTLLWFPSRYKC